MALYPVVLAGGSGTRLWPLSRSRRPKQFLAIGGERSLLQQTLLRLRGVPDAAAPVIVCNEEHRYLVAEHCRQAGVAPSAIVLEPAGRSTAPALTLGALRAAELARRDEPDADPVLLVAPADHVLRGESAFRDAVSVGASFARQGRMAAVGVVPNAPNTGYGYIERGEPLRSVPQADEPDAHRVASFVEKPNQSTARRLVESGRFLWNSGIFLCRASVWLEQLARHRPDVARPCERAYALGRQDGEFFRPDADAFAQCPGDFIAYDIMEKIAGRPGEGETPAPDGPDCVVVPLDAGWSDVGSWRSTWDEERKDADGNAIRGDVYAESVRGSLLIGGERLVAVVGLDDVVVVDAPDCVLVADMERAEQVRAVVERLRAEGRPEV